MAQRRKRDYKRELQLANRRGDKKYRARVNKCRRKIGKKGDGKDVSHSKRRGKGSCVLSSRSKNRSRGGRSGKDKGTRKA